jgi:hypothetical protein
MTHICESIACLQQPQHHPSCAKRDATPPTRQFLLQADAEPNALAQLFAPLLSNTLRDRGCADTPWLSANDAYTRQVAVNTRFLQDELGDLCCFATASLTANEGYLMLLQRR